MLVIRPVLAAMGTKFQGRDAEGLLLAIALEETWLAYRRQIHGPAMGFWQFELGGVAGVLKHRASAAYASRWGFELLYADNANDIHPKLADNDILACIFARLLLYTDPAPLPSIDGDRACWEYYWRNWRPGAFKTWKPGDGLPERWIKSLVAARASL